MWRHNLLFFVMSHNAIPSPRFLCMIYITYNLYSVRGVYIKTIKPKTTEVNHKNRHASPALPIVFPSAKPSAENCEPTRQNDH